jgi:ADP-ribose pyrophosphatase
MRDHPDIDVEHEETLSDGFLRLKRYRLRHRRFAGDWTPSLVREVCERGLAVAVLLYDPDADAVVLVEQFRPGAAVGGGPAWLTEIVAGMVKPGEPPEEVARREAMEEAGARVGELLKICDYYPSPGILSEKVALYCGRVDSTKVDSFGGVPEEDEDIKISVVSADQAITLLDTNRLNNSIAIIALSWLARRRDNVRTAWLG